jgi:hypothetical protein
MFALLCILFLTIAGTFILTWYERPKADTFTQTVLPLMTTLVGSALGFYFGGKSKEEEEEKEINNEDSQTAEPIKKSPPT